MHICEELSRLRLASENIYEGEIVFIMLIDVGSSILNAGGGGAFPEQGILDCVKVGKAS